MKKALLALAFLTLAFVAGCKQPQTIRIGYQKYGVLLILKQRGTLDAALRDTGVSVEWAEFPSGPPMMEAFNAGKIDFGVAGEAPPVFGQAGGAPIVYVAADPASPRAEAILVPKGSPVTSVAGLRGKKLALNRGSNVHYFVAAALAAAGVDYKDISLVFLPPSDARAAFEKGEVDAWAIWDPFLSSALRSVDVQVLCDATGVASNVPYYLATRGYASAHADVIRAVERQIRGVDAFVSAHPHDAAALLAPAMGLPVEAVEDSLGRNTFDLRAIDPPLVAAQQKVADTFFALGLIPRAVRISDAVVPIVD